MNRYIGGAGFGAIGSRTLSLNVNAGVPNAEFMNHSKAKSHLFIPFWSSPWARFGRCLSRGIATGTARVRQLFVVA